ncbi:MAG: ATP-binding cassette domain-containing protein [Nitrospirae bacterium]|nr:MAG: ATP-binding cassette domain-containing protein [Nitrospirota bacterium]
MCSVYKNNAHIVVQNLTMAYGEHIIMEDLNFTINRGEIFIIMGGSGCGKSTLLRHLIGLHRPAKGKIFYRGVDFWGAEDEEREHIMRSFGIMYQSGALWSSMTLAENIALPLKEYTNLAQEEIEEIVSLKLSLVGLSGFEDYYPSQLSGGMRKRAALARAMVLDPDILFFDEPSAGLDPVSAKMLDDLIKDLRESLGSTIVVVTHELASIFYIGTDSIFLDAESKSIRARGNPKKLLSESDDPKVRNFLTRGGGTLCIGE